MQAIRKIHYTLILAIIMVCLATLSAYAMGEEARADDDPPLFNLPFEAGVVMKSGDVKPMARCQFILLNQDRSSLWKEVVEDINEQIEETRTLSRQHEVGFTATMERPTIANYLQSSSAPDSIKRWCSATGFVPQKRTLEYDPPGVELVPQVWSLVADTDRHWYYVEWIEPRRGAQHESLLGVAISEKVTHLFPVEELKRNEELFDAFKSVMLSHLWVLAKPPEMPDPKLKEKNPSKYDAKMSKFWDSLQEWETRLDEKGMYDTELIMGVLEKVADSYFPRSFAYVLVDYEMGFVQPLWKEALAEATVATSVTDLQGNGVFLNVPTGRYWVSSIGYLPIGESLILWNYEVRVSKDGTITHALPGPVILSNDNSYEGR